MYAYLNCGGEKCVAKAQAAYFKRQSDAPNYLRLLASVVGKNLWDLVYNADLKDWKEVMATLATFADQSEFPDLCEALGDRLEEAISDEAGSYRKDASFCYLAGSKLEKVVVNWAQELKETEAAGLEKSEDDNSFSIHARSLQDFIEKVTVFRKVTNFKDAEQQKDADWKLEPLYAKYVEYADIASSHGQLSIAEKYLDLLPQKYPAAEVAKDRVKRATQKAAPQAQRQSQPAAGGRATRVVPTPTPAQQSTPYAPTNPLSTPAPANSSPYAPINPLSSQAQAQVQSQPAVRNPYLPQPNAFAQQPSPIGQNGAGYGGYGQPQQSSLPPPPRAGSIGAMPPTSTVPAANRGHIPAWNDTPDFGLPKPASRRGTPLNTVGSPFPNQQQYGAPPPGPPQGRPTPPPPPKGPPQGPPRVMSPPQSSASPSAPNPYAPAQPTGFAPPTQAPVARGASPYAPPTSAAPASNRYAPAPGSQPSPAPAYGGMPPPRNIAPPPTQFTPAPSPYAPSPAQQAPPAATPPPPRGPPQGPPRAGPPPSAPQQSGPPRPDSRSSAPPPAAAAPVAKHPRGDRTHIPAGSQPIFDILSADMQRVKAKAPEKFKAHVIDTEKRLNILFDHLNNDDVKPDTVQQLNDLANNIQARNYDQAGVIFSDIMTNKTDEGSDWIVGIKRLLQFSKSTQ